MRICGAAIAGGRSRRYGSPKAFARVGGRMLMERVLDALRDASDEQVVITNDPDAYRSFGLPLRTDTLHDAGAAGGIHAALLYAAERACDGVVTLACDMPFPSAALLRELAAHARSHGADVVAPASEGPRGLEPLCAYYAISCIAPIEHAVARADLRVIGFHGEVRVDILPMEAVVRFGDPARLFLNVNTEEDRAHAETLTEADT